jgi:hypothetical protein
MRHEINKLISKELFKIDEKDTIHSYGQHVHVLHQDGSEYKIKHARVEKRNIKGTELTVVFCEHNTVNVFVDIDLEFAKFKPWNGREHKIKLQSAAAWRKAKNLKK